MQDTMRSIALTASCVVGSLSQMARGDKMILGEWAALMVVGLA